jgi:phospholipase/carboxylesterase
MIVSGSHAGLDYDLHLPAGANDGATALVLLHGRGSHKGDLQAMAPVLPADWVLVTPQAPYPGADWGYGPGWAWYRYVQEDRLEPDTLDRSLELLDGFLASLEGVMGLSPVRVVLGGFSQGGTTSLAYALTRPGRLAATLNFSGFLAASVKLPARDAPDRSITPVFWGHGERDGNIPIGLAVRGRASLERAGIPLVARDYPIGHWMTPEEVHDAVAMVEGGG